MQRLLVLATLASFPLLARAQEDHESPSLLAVITTWLPFLVLIGLWFSS